MTSSAADSFAFEPFSAPHLAALAVVALAGALAFHLGRTLGPSGRKAAGRLLALLILGYGGAVYTRQALAWGLGWAWSLPLDLCNLTLIVCVAALWRPRPLLIEYAYYLGIGGGVQALATPDLAGGGWDFVLFFWGHGVVLAAVLFLVSGPAFAMRPGAVGRMMLGINLYALAVGALNAAAGWNYGYLCRKPAAPSLLDHLGPWPWYLAALEGIALATFLVLDLPWRLRRRRKP
jgi:hypothetical integral membrane protein (TIGR02206 family)